jgi:hypothetical protein
MREYLVDYLKYWAAHDPLIPKMLRAPKPPGALMLSQEYLSSDEVARSDYCQKFMIPGGVQHQAAWVLEDSVEVHAMIDLVRGGPAVFERAHLCELQEVIGHLQRALQMSLQLAKSATAEVRWRQAVEQTHVMCVIVDANARLLDQSAAAAGLLSSQSDLRIQAGRLAASTAEQTQRAAHPRWTRCARICTARWRRPMLPPRWPRATRRRRSRSSETSAFTQCALRCAHCLPAPAPRASGSSSRCSADSE